MFVAGSILEDITNYALEPKFLSRIRSSFQRDRKFQQKSLYGHLERKPCQDETGNRQHENPEQVSRDKDIIHDTNSCGSLAWCDISYNSCRLGEVSRVSWNLHSTFLLVHISPS
jgi:hypothetical protein